MLTDISYTRLTVDLTYGKVFLPWGAMAATANRRDVVIAALRSVRADIDMSSLTDNTRLISGLGCASIDGVYLAAELEAVLDVVVPHDQNPLVREDDGRKRDRTLAELVSWTATLTRKSATGGASA